MEAAAVVSVHSPACPSSPHARSAGWTLLVVAAVGVVVSLLTWRATDAGLASAQEAFDAVSARFDVGLGIFLDVETAQAALSEARAQHAAAAVNLVLQKQVLHYVTGTPLGTP